MTNELRLMLILAHPDDESLGNGGMVAKYVAEGVETYLVTATRGEQGWFGPEDENPGPEELGRIREAELLEAAEVLGIREVSFLDYRDGEFDRAPADEVVAKIVRHIRRVKPHVVVTFDQNGLYGHPDHIAICQHATAAVAAAGDATFSERRRSVNPPCIQALLHGVDTGGRRAVSVGVRGADDANQRSPTRLRPLARMGDHHPH